MKKIGSVALVGGKANPKVENEILRRLFG